MRMGRFNRRKRIMKQKQINNGLVWVIAVLFAVLGTCPSVFGCGDGGGDAMSISVAVTPPPATPLSSSKTSKISRVCNTKSRSKGGASKAGGMLLTDLLGIRVLVTGTSGDTTGLKGRVVTGLTGTCANLDKAGTWNRNGVSFVNGGNWVTSGAIDPGKGIPTTYQPGQNAALVLKTSVLQSVGTVNISRLTAPGVTAILNNAQNGECSLALKASDKPCREILDFAQASSGTTGGVATAKDDPVQALKISLGNTWKKAPNRAPMPTYLEGNAGQTIGLANNN